ncbi:GroES-like protein [Cubamyces sp. BRFM 1775]|nr:GroES-like protein [Cubamyces sp. BRFM 1775]
MSIPTTQKALLVLKESSPHVLGDNAVPRPAPHEVLVKIVACGLNLSDAVVMDPPFSKVLVSSWPYIAGSDGSGVVIEVGTNVTNLKEGDRILFQGNSRDPLRSSTFQEYAVVDAQLAAIIPSNITFEQAASIPLALITDVTGLFNQSPAPQNLGLRYKPVWEPEGATERANTPAFIVGGAASLGQYAIQLAKMAGHNPIITTASSHNEAHLISLGSTHVLDRSRSNESILEELPKLTNGQPIKFAFVAVVFSHDSCRLARDALAPGGDLLTAAPGPALLPGDVSNPGQEKRVAYGHGSPHLPHTRDVCIELYKHLTEWLESGSLKPNPIEVLPGGLAGVAEALSLVKAHKVSGKKFIARPQDTQSL